MRLAKKVTENNRNKKDDIISILLHYKRRYQFPKYSKESYKICSESHTDVAYFNFPCLIHFKYYLELETQIIH